MIYLLCILLPPAAVLFKRPSSFLISLILTLCLWVPGIIHAFFVVSDAKSEERNKRLINAVEKSK